MKKTLNEYESIIWMAVNKLEVILYYGWKL